MSKLTLVVIDTAKIQPYIFGSNRLRENVGASHLVHLATGGWLKDEPETLLPSRHNITAGKIQITGEIGQLRIEEGMLDAEVLYAGGGNTAILFADRSHAMAFARKLSERVLCEAPGLDVVLTQQEFEWETSLAQVLHAAFEDLGRKKREREFPQPLLGLGVTAACRATGLPANREEPEPGEQAPGSGIYLPLSSSAYAKWLQNGPAKERLRNDLLQDPGGSSPIATDFVFPDDFDHLGRALGEQSYLAVVHADGNGMGKLFDELNKSYHARGGNDNRDYITQLRDLSEQVNHLGQRALAAVVRKVWEWNQPQAGEDPLLAPYVNGIGQKYLSIRPIVFGGDDVTFVCEGRIGLWAASVFLEHFRQTPIMLKHVSRTLHAAAGVAMVKVHYPFARAYDLSEALCKHAKTESGRDHTALDWHIAQSGLFGKLSELRTREYQEQKSDEKVTRSLLMRPLLLEEKTTQWRTWENFVQLAQTLRDPEAWPRNKVLDLRTALIEGESAVRQFVANYRRLLPGLATLSKGSYQEAGWHTNGTAQRAVYFDAIEMLDQQLPAAYKLNQPEEVQQ
jgi:hypothetical protein